MIEWIGQSPHELGDGHHMESGADPNTRLWGRPSHKIPQKHLKLKNSYNLSKI